LILDSMRDVFQGQMDTMKMRTKTTIVALDRSMLALLKDLRTAGNRPMARVMPGARPAAVPVEPRNDSASAPSSPDAMPDAAEMPPAQPVAPVPEIVVVPTAMPLRETAPAEAGPTTSNPSRIGQPRVPSSDPGPSVDGPLQANDETLDMVKMPRHPIASAEETTVDADGSDPSAPPPREADDGTLEEHVAAFQAAMVAMAETLAEAKALDALKAEAEANAASGD